MHQVIKKGYYSKVAWHGVFGRAQATTQRQKGAPRGKAQSFDKNALDAYDCPSDDLNDLNLICEYWIDE